MSLVSDTVVSFGGTSRRINADTQVVRHLITPEYPPQPGGVGDYTKLVAEGLAAAGEEIHVWCPFLRDQGSQQAGVSVHGALQGANPRGLRHLGEQLDHFPPPRRLLVQWVPHGYGYRSMNLPFCFWLWNRSRLHGDRIDIMAHEAFLSFGEGSWRQDAAALVHRLMTVILLRSAQRVWISIPTWERSLQPYKLGRPIQFQWLPVPSNITVVNDPAAIQNARERYARDGALLIGHFGTFRRPVVSVLEPILLSMKTRLAGKTILLMGMGSQDFCSALIRRVPEFENHIQATGPLASEELSCHLAACDLLIQPYPYGVSTRRGSFMAGLSHGKAILTTSGHLTEPLWLNSNAVGLAPYSDVAAFTKQLEELCADPGRRASMALAARNFYLERFDISHTVAALRAAGAPEYQTCGSST
jgi:glycosyltransferase involved in cell wall biosynthesis